MSTASIVNERKPFQVALADFFRKFALQLLIILLLVQLSLAASWAWTWLLYWHGMFHPVFLRSAAVTGTALAAGLIMRVFLRDHLRILRWLCALVSSIVSLGCLSFITDSQVGIPFSLVHQPTVNWDGLVQVLAAGLVCWLTLYAWVRPRQTSANTPPEQPAIPAAQTPLAVEILAEPIVAMTPVEESPIREHRPTLPAWLHWPWIHTQTGTTVEHPPAVPMPVAEIPVRVRRPIRLIGAEEHRCPYCLEIIQPNDPAGVEICPICHAHHHKACWQVTGNCQVPHIQP
jgi:hypothetical protein